MENRLSGPAKIYVTVMALLCWFALAGQFYINLNSKTASIPEIIIRYFSYFTILTNLLIGLCCIMLLFSPGSKLGVFFSRQQTQTAITVYIVIVGLIYNIILRFLWVPEGLQRIVDELLHSITPVLFLIYWLVFSQKNQLQWTNILLWLIFPFSYIIYVLIRGSASGFYPYPFINTNQLGLNKVLVNSVGIAVFFICLSLIFVAIGKSMSKKA
jgi:hypothetical protein